jgi:hypothetical protein
MMLQAALRHEEVLLPVCMQDPQNQAAERSLNQLLQIFKYEILFLIKVSRRQATRGVWSKNSPKRAPVLGFVH